MQQQDDRPVIYDPTQITSPGNYSNPQPGDPCHPLAKTAHVPLLVDRVYSDNQNRGFRVHSGLTPPLLRNMGTGGGNVPFVRQDIAIPINTMTCQGRPSDNGRMGLGIGEDGEDGDPQNTISKAHHHAVAAGANNILIRRLTPKECGRLQGFPDGYLEQVPGYSDSKAYAAFGNSMTTYVMQWIGQRIELVDRCLKEMQEKKIVEPGR